MQSVRDQGSSCSLRRYEHRVSGCKQKEHSDVEFMPHLARFFLMGNELFIYRIVKLNMF